jgi:hypothetical protein
MTAFFGSGKSFLMPRQINVGITGFEPATSSSRTTRATGLRYIPNACWSRTRDLNPRPADYESAALPLS